LWLAKQKKCIRIKLKRALPSQTLKLKKIMDKIFFMASSLKKMFVIVTFMWQRIQ